MTPGPVTPAPPSLDDLRIGHGLPGVASATTRPPLSWTITGAVAEEQTEVEVRCRAVAPGIGRSASRPESTVSLPAAAHLGAEWPFDPLHDGEAVEVSARLRVGSGWTDWSRPARVQAGICDQAEWTARWITSVGVGGLDDAAPVFEKELSLAPVRRALLTLTARGILVAYINGRRVGDEHLAPGWTSYQHRYVSRTHDVSALVVDGENLIEVLVGNGWHRGQLVWPGNRSSYGADLALAAQLDVLGEDGRWTRRVTDPTWSCRASRVLSDDLYDGQATDHRRPLLRAQGAAPAAEAVRELEVTAVVEAAEAPPVRASAIIHPRAEWRSPRGARILDFGENVVGWVRVADPGGVPDTAIRIRHAEVLEGGELGTRPLRSAQATDVHIRAAAGGEREPSLTFHGFRYVEVEGADDIDADGFAAVVLTSDLRRTGWFRASDDRVNRLHDNVLRSMRGNFVSIPTDCPQRDERLGWTGDAQIFSPTAAFLADTRLFYASWLRDLALEQGADGGVPSIVPDVLRDPGSASAAGWGDAAVVLPWVLWERYADREVLRRQYPSMRAWVEHVRGLAGDGVWEGGFQYGDWLDPTAPPEDAAAVKADPGVVATAHYARSARLLSRAAAVLGMADEASRYAALADRVTLAFRDAYLGGDGRIRSDCPTVYALAIAFDLLDDGSRAAAGRRLAELVRDAAHVIETGFLGTPVLLDALADTGHLDDAYAVLLQDEHPSWLYAVRMGATTVWERWDSMLPDGSINPGSMTSFNHYAYGAVADWMHRVIGGLQSLEPGFRSVRVAPRPGGGITSARTEYASDGGPIVVAWSVDDDGEMTLDLDLPHGCSAEVVLPGAPSRAVGSGRHRFTSASRTLDASLAGRP